MTCLLVLCLAMHLLCFEEINANAGRCNPNYYEAKKI